MDSPILQSVTEVTPPEESTKDLNGCDSNANISEDGSPIITEINSTEDLDHIVIVQDPQTPRRLNKTAYAKLQRSLSPTKINRNLDTLKEKYENSDTQIENQQDCETDKPKLKRSPAIKLDDASVQVLRNKSKLPVARPRNAVKSELIVPSRIGNNRSKFRHSFNPEKNLRKKDENANDLIRKNSSSSGEIITIVTRSESEGSIDKFTKELNMFTLEKKPKEKKRSNSFRKIFSGKIFSKEKKKKEDDNKCQYRENAAYNDNVQNESNSFSRESPLRHTTGSNSNIPRPTRFSRIDDKRPTQQTNYEIRDIEKHYAQMHVKEFNNIKQNFDKQHPDNNEKPINNPGPIDYKRISTIKEFIDNSSSASTSESERCSTNKQLNGDNDTLNKFNRFGDNHRDRTKNTPPRAQELRQDVKLVNPKALIPINSERPLPNPYQNLSKQRVSPSNISPKHNQFNFVDDSKIDRPYLEETYGTVLDSIEQKFTLPQRPSTAKLDQKPPRSPSLESSKIILPPNREITPLSPRMKSPIPQHHVSTEKIIATELLRSSRSPTPTRKKTSQLSPSHQKLEIGIDYPDNINDRSFETRVSVTTKPPISRVSDRVYGQNNRQSPGFEKRFSQASPPIPRTHGQGQVNQHPPYFENRTNQDSPTQGHQDKILTNAMVHTNMARTPTPNTLLHNRSLSPMALPITNMSPMQSLSTRSNTPVDIRSSPSTNKSQSPQKEDMKRSVEAYYWKEIKKLKDQENHELYYYQMHMMPFGYAEDPISIRRARSSSPSSNRNSRRSLSLPRESKTQVQVNPIGNYSMFKSPPIPEGRTVIHQPDGVYYQQNFRRNTPERSTVGSATNANTYSNTIYRPIFKRGSLTTPVRELFDDQQKKVSFNNSKDSQNNQSWPTRNGYTQSPPQRRIEVNRNNSLEDDVFLPNTHQPSRRVMDGREIYGYANRPADLPQNQYVSRQQLYQQNPNMRYIQDSQEPIGTSRQMIDPQGEVYRGETVDYGRMPRGLVRHGSIQLQDPVYGRLPRRMSLDSRGPHQAQVSMQNPNFPPPRRQIFLNGDIYGTFGGYHPPNDSHNMVYESRQSIVESVYGYNQNTPRNISINNKVCDIYGQIHDKDNPNQIQRTGVILGQLQSSPQFVRHPPPLQLQDNFVRNSRLTASANDMHRRYQNKDPRYASDVMYRQYMEKQQDGAPSRPLPPVPSDKKIIVRHNTERVNSDNEQSFGVGKSKKRVLHGKHQESNNSQLTHYYLLEETMHLDTLELERLVLSEKLKLLRMEKILEDTSMNNASMISRGSTEIRNSRLFSHENDEKLHINELRRSVLLEELQLIRMKMKRLLL